MIFRLPEPHGLSRLGVARLLGAGLLAAAASGTAMLAVGQFRRDIAAASALAKRGSEMLATACGPIEVQQAGSGVPLLMIHGSGGGHDQGMNFARPLAAHGVRVIAVSRFGYLRTPRPSDASPEAQADAHRCVIDALGIERAAVLGASAGAPSALLTAIRHPGRVSHLVLVVPIVHKPGAVADSAAPVSDQKDDWLLRLLGSDVLYWAAWRLVPDQVFRHVLATPPEHVHAASAEERARVQAMAAHVLPVSARAAGVRDDTRLGKRLPPAALDTVRAPTLVISARDDAFGTYAGAEHTARGITGARFIGYDTGGHLLVGHGDELMHTIGVWLTGAKRAGP